MFRQNRATALTGLGNLQQNPLACAVLSLLVSGYVTYTNVVKAFASLLRSYYLPDGPSLWPMLNPTYITMTNI